MDGEVAIAARQSAEETRGAMGAAGGPDRGRLPEQVRRRPPSSSFIQGPPRYRISRNRDPTRSVLPTIVLDRPVAQEGSVKYAPSWLAPYVGVIVVAMLIAAILGGATILGLYIGDRG